MISDAHIDDSRCSKVDGFVIDLIAINAIFTEFQLDEALSIIYRPFQSTDRRKRICSEEGGL